MQEEATKDLKNTLKVQKSLKDRATRLENLLNYNQPENKQ
jgi:hypothetical protein